MRQYWDWSVAFAFVLISGVTLCLGLVGIGGWERAAMAIRSVDSGWVQAIGGLAGLAVAIVAPYLHAEGQRRSSDLAQLKYLRALLSRADELVRAIEDAVDDGSLPYYMDETYVPRDSDELANLIERVPFHELADPDLVVHLLRVKSALTAVTGAAKYVCGAWEEDNNDPSDGIDAIRTFRRETKEAVAAVEASLASV